jgi:DNA-directed RNA polymerase subunit M/transcription elongation factor TFIIS
MDIFQVSVNSADAKPGKGTGETLVSPPSTYASLAAISHWRRKLATGDMSPLPLTGQAELWEFTPGKGKNRQTNWEEMRRSDLTKDQTGLSAQGNLPKQEVEMEQAPKMTMKEKLAAKKAEIKAKEEAAATAATALVSGEASTLAKPATEKQLSVKEPLATKKSKKESTTVASASAVTTAVAAAPVVESLRPESTLAADVGEPIALRVPEVDEESKSHTIRFCPTCNYYLYLNESHGGEDAGALYRICHNCGYKEMDAKGGLVSEILVKERSTESYKILLNEYTRRDPRLPHIRGIMKCPSETCQSNVGGTESDIIYMKYDGVNLMYLYICDVCGYKWHSRR